MLWNTEDKYVTTIRDDGWGNPVKVTERNPMYVPNNNK